MQITRELDWNGTTVRITKTKATVDKTAYCDGNVHEIGKATVDSVDIELIKDGKRIVQGGEPKALNAAFPSEAKMIKQGAYATINAGVYIGKDKYDQLMAVLAEMDTELEVPEDYEEVKTEEDKRKEQARKNEQEVIEYERCQRANGLCPKCGTYCNGDCEAH